MGVPDAGMSAVKVVERCHSVPSASQANYRGGMTRWNPGSRERLQEAALNLFSEQGYENTTVTQIAERVGVNRRTFFRNFADKRDVLFSFAEDMQRFLADAIAEAPGELSPLNAVATAISTLDEWMAPRPYLRQRQAVIAASPELMERELIKMEALTVAFTEGLRRRGNNNSVSDLAARAGITVFRTVFERWIDVGNERAMSQIVDEVLIEFRAAVTF